MVLANTCHVYVCLARHIFNDLEITLFTDVYNKIDAISLEQMDKIAREDHTVVISCEMGLKYAIIYHVSRMLTPFIVTSLDYLIERIWADLNLVKVYTKKRGVHPDLSDPVCLRKGATIEVTEILRLQISHGRLKLIRTFAMGSIDL